MHMRTLRRELVRGSLRPRRLRPHAPEPAHLIVRVSFVRRNSLPPRSPSPVAIRRALHRGPVRPHFRHDASRRLPQFRQLDRIKRQRLARLQISEQTTRRDEPTLRVRRRVRVRIFPDWRLDDPGPGWANARASTPPTPTFSRAISRAADRYPRVRVPPRAAPSRAQPRRVDDATPWRSPVIFSSTPTTRPRRFRNPPTPTPGFEPTAPSSPESSRRRTVAYPPETSPRGTACAG